MAGRDSALRKLVDDGQDVGVFHQHESGCCGLIVVDLRVNERAERYAGTSAAGAGVLRLGFLRLGCGFLLKLAGAVNCGLTTALRILFDGMTNGTFTGKKLADYDYLITRSPDVPGYRYYQSRAIINDDVAANGAHIATYAKAFERALTAAGYTPAKDELGARVQPGGTWVFTEKAPEQNGSSTAKIEQGPVPGGNWLSALLSVLGKIITGWRK